MFKHTRKVTRVVTRTLTAASLAAIPLFMANACSSDSEHTVVTVGEDGRLQLNLTGISNTNLVYQLRNATFSISGLSTEFFAEVNTESQPNTSSLLVELPPDTFQVFLQPGYYLELLPGGLPPEARRAASSRPGSATRGPGKVAARNVVGAFAADAGAPPTEEPPPPAPGGTVVDATLVSSNPGMVTVQPNVVSPLNFIFQVGDGIVETGNGVLDIGIAVIDNGRVCVPDPFEPNDDQAFPSPITPGEQITASLCDQDVDNYIFPAPVPEGEQFAATLQFSTAAGDIDAVLIEAATGLIVAFGGGVSDTETLATISNGGDYILQTFLFFDPEGGGNTYTVDVGEFANNAENSCCTISDTPGCNDDEVLSCVCDLDSFCCAVAFDPLCVSEALACGGTCPNDGAESDCCSASPAPGCTDQTVHDCVCATDFACCSSGFDDVCVTQAIAECGAQCSLPPPVSDCCSASSTPGCTLPEVQACVCGIDPFCCAAGFDENCAALADSQCGAECLF
jgi:hypothetical protein